MHLRLPVKVLLSRGQRVEASLQVFVNLKQMLTPRNNFSNSSHKSTDENASSETEPEPFVHEQPANNIPFECLEEILSQSKMPKDALERKKLVVFGGNGYVGLGIVAAALNAGVNVVSINRSGSPKKFTVPAIASPCVHVYWKKGDISKPETYRSELDGAAGVISCVGAFGSNEFMEKVNGDANITAIEACARAHVPRFVYISAVENNLPKSILRGYFSGKRRTENALLNAFPDTGIVLRPGFIHGTRTVSIGNSTYDIPLWIIGKPLESIFSTTPVQYLRTVLPGMQAILAPPIAREDLAAVAVRAALGRCHAKAGILTIEDIKNEAKDAQERAKI